MGNTTTGLGHIGDGSQKRDRWRVSDHVVMKGPLQYSRGNLSVGEWSGSEVCIFGVTIVAVVTDAWTVEKTA